MKMFDGLVSRQNHCRALGARVRAWGRAWGRHAGIGAMALVAVAGMALSARSYGGNSDPKTATVSGAADAKQAAALAKTLSKAFRNAASDIGQSVVSIRVEKKSTTPTMAFGGEGGQEMPQLPPGMEKFFGHFFDGGSPDESPSRRQSPRWRQQREPRVQGQGSGVIATADGDILTNAHVVDGAQSITVVLSDGTEHPAKVVGVDKDGDLAVVKIEASGLTAARFADSDDVQPGDWCVAVGNPLGLDHTVTAGIVSAKSRSNVGSAAFEDFIQTDAPINPGNSGGPLVNLDGEVIGINTAIRTSSGGSEGIGFAIPSNTAQSVMRSLIDKGHVERGWLGVSIQPLTPDLATSLGTTPKHGVLIGDVLPDAPASKAGIRAGDIVLSVNGAPVGEPGQMMSRVARISPGSSAELRVLRDGSGKAFAVKLGTRPANGGASEEKASPTESGSLGLSVQPLDKSLREQFNLKADENGLAVTDVAAGSPAERAGLQPGDVILNAGGKAAPSAEQFREMAAKATADKGLLLRVKRGETARFLVIKPGE